MKSVGLVGDEARRAEIGAGGEEAVGEQLIRPAQVEGAALDGVVVEPDEVLRPGHTGQPFGPPEHVKATVGCGARDGLVEHTRSQSGDLFVQQISRAGRA